MLFFKYLIMYKKKIIILSIISLFASGFLPYGLINSKEAVKSDRISHAELCCCGHDASTCRSCGCSDGAGESDNGKQPVTITSCGGTPNEIFTSPIMNYFFSQSIFINYLPVTTLAETVTLQRKDVLNKPPYKPPEPQLLTNFT